jgi:hypothetical protein
MKRESVNKLLLDLLSKADISKRSNELGLLLKLSTLSDDKTVHDLVERIYKNTSNHRVKDLVEHIYSLNKRGNWSEYLRNHMTAPRHLPMGVPKSWVQ